MPSQRPRRGCVWRALWIYLCFVASTVGLVIALGYILSWWRWKTEDAAWADTGLSMEQFAAEHPRAIDNPAALRLDELTREIGIESIGHHKVGDRRALQMAKDPALKAVSDYLRTFASTHHDDTVAAPPAQVRAYFQDNAAAIDAIESHLITGGVIAWEEDLDQGTAAPVPALLGVRSLQNVLLVRAADALRRRDTPRAARSLEASWSHSESLRRRADILSQLIAIAVAGMQNSVLRLWQEPPTVWIERVDAADFRERMLQSYQAEAYGWRTFTQRYKGVADMSEADGAPPREDRLLDPVIRFPTVPYVRLSFAGISQEIRRGRRELEAGDPCLFDPDEMEQQTKARFPRWNTIGKIAVPPLYRAWASVRDVMLDNELTRLVMDARRRQALSKGWESAAPVPSQICRRAVWIQEPLPGGRRSIRLEAAPMPAPRKESWTFTLDPTR